jgi:hypothetical protein
MATGLDRVLHKHNGLDGKSFKISGRIAVGPLAVRTREKGTPISGRRLGEGLER